MMFEPRREVPETLRRLESLHIAKIDDYLVSELCDRVGNKLWLASFAAAGPTWNGRTFPPPTQTLQNELKTCGRSVFMNCASDSLRFGQ